jgi:hypothetical protein
MSDKTPPNPLASPTPLKDATTQGGSMVSARPSDPAAPKRRVLMPSAAPDPLQKQLDAAKKAASAQPTYGSATARTRALADANLKESLKDFPQAALVRFLAGQTESPRLDKAMDMLRGSKCSLYSEITPEAVSGVVRSQNDPSTYYSPTLRADGHFCCVDQHMDLCKGLRQLPCKHMMVLLIGLCQAGQLADADIRTWVGRAVRLPHDARITLDAEKQTLIFIKYKAAQDGSVDWRPTETIPEDYYAL